MARTICTDYREHPVRDNLDLAKVIEIAQDWYESAQGDEDKSGSIEDASYYEGIVSGITSILRLLTAGPPICARCGKSIEQATEKALSGEVATVWSDGESWVCADGNEHEPYDPDVTTNPETQEV